MSNNKLTDKQSKFIDEFLKDSNATQAAKRAGYSEDSARQVGSENLSKPYIADEIARRRKIVSEKTGLTIEALDKYILEMSSMAKKACDFSGMNNAADKWGKRLNAYTHTIDHKSSDKSMSTITDEDQAILNRYKPQDDG